MRISLRWKILLVTLLTPLTLGLATWTFVQRRVTAHVNSSSLHESLEQSQLVFESMLRTRERALAGSARVIARDPRFFSVLMLRGAQRDRDFLATVRWMARDFSRISETDLFEVFDLRGSLLAAVGPRSTSRDAHGSVVREALRGREVTTTLVDAGHDYQVAVVPVQADGRTVGALLLGSEIGGSLARVLRSQMRCDVTFVSGNAMIGTTLSSPADREALTRTLDELSRDATVDAGSLGVLKVKSTSDTYLTLIRRIPSSDPVAGQFYVLQRSFDAESIFLNTMQGVLLMLGTIAVVVALLTGFLFSEQIVRPLHNLVRGAQEMERGNYDFPIPTGGGDEIGYLGRRFVDMRQRERAYVESLEHSALLKSEFLRLAAHELRTPISVLAGYRDLWAGGAMGPVTDQQRRGLDAMKDAIARLTRFTEEAAEFARLKGERVSLAIGPCDVPALLRFATGQALTLASGRAVKVEIECASFVRSISVDEGALGRALTHLIANGIRFTPDGGRVVVRARMEGEGVRVEVEDTGVGIAPKRLSELLTRWLPLPDERDQLRPTSLAFNSTGLGRGIATARAIVQAHGGTLGATSVEGSGSTFWFEVPAEARTLGQAA
jgi:two-component system sensor histidine kinase BaeS